MHDFDQLRTNDQSAFLAFTDRGGDRLGGHHDCVAIVIDLDEDMAPLDADLQLVQCFLIT